MMVLMHVIYVHADFCQTFLVGENISGFAKAEQFGSTPNYWGGPCDAHVFEGFFGLEMNPSNLSK